MVAFVGAVALKQLLVKSWRPNRDSWCHTGFLQVQQDSNEPSATTPGVSSSEEQQG
jgi:hypothetical protein